MVNLKIENWCKKCTYSEGTTPMTCDTCKSHEKSVIRVFGSPIEYKPKNNCDHGVLEVTVVDVNVYDNNDTVIVTRQYICEECGENVEESYDQVYKLVR